MNNPVLAKIAEGMAAKSEVEKLRAAMEALLAALDGQYLDGKPPGSYHYSGNVVDACHYARSLVRHVPMPEAPPADKAKTL